MLKPDMLIIGVNDEKKLRTKFKSKKKIVMECTYYILVFC